MDEMNEGKKIKTLGNFFNLVSPREQLSWGERN
jgi:hypothetical protein